ncbi:hypothetical protein CJF30_00000720 [Rutstroemia sp. NJR-2017a BBW]|nr:hypothetical protein CJF30_00000720 [Rutstroemia sp. NJR-2017a BBW]
MDVIRPRRPHHKSRTGCLQCKARKVKCDEKKPSCQKCRSYGSECSYLQTHPMKSLQSRDALYGPTAMRKDSKSPTPISTLPPRVELSPASTLSSASSAGALESYSTLDMELLHFWTMHTATEFIEFPTGQELLRTNVVELAFEYPFLMHEILALAALQLSQARPHKAVRYSQASSTHLAIALHLFQSEISHLTPANCHAVFIFISTVFVFAWTGQEQNIPSHLFFGPEKTLPSHDINFPQFQWVRLQRGTHNILKSQWATLSAGPFSPIFNPWAKVSAPEYIPPLDPIDDLYLSSLSMAWSSTSSSTLPISQRRLLDHSLAMLRRAFGLWSTHKELAPLGVVMDWLVMIPDEVEGMFAEKVKEALLLVAYYCVLLHKMSHIQWMRGKGIALLKSTLDALGPGWQKWTGWPIEVVLGREWRGGNTMSLNFINDA